MLPLRRIGNYFVKYRNDIQRSQWMVLSVGKYLETHVSIDTSVEKYLETRVSMDMPDR